MSNTFENPLHTHAAQTSEVQKWLVWAKKHQEMVFVGGLVLLLIAIGIPYYFHSQDKANVDAQGVLSLAQYYQHAQVDPKNGPFKTEAEKNQQAMSTFQRCVNDFAGTPTAKLARLYMAKDQLVLGQFAQAYSSFDVASQELKGTPLGDEAYLGKIIALENDNKFTQAIGIAESFLKDNKTSSIYPEVALCLADLYVKNQNKDKATEQLKAIVKDYADSSWGKEAAHRLENAKS